MHTANWKIILAYWAPVVGVMMLIFYASSQPQLPVPPNTSTVYMSGSMPMLVDYSLNTLIKKSAHIVLYGLLAGLTLRAWVAHGVSAREAASLAIALALGYAITDELHQSTVLGRHSSALDIGFDYIGASVVSLTLRWRLTNRSVGSPLITSDQGIR